MILKKYSKHILGVAALLSTINSASALDYNLAGNYFGIDYDYTAKIASYNDIMELAGNQASLQISNKNGFGVHGVYRYVLDNDFFLDAKAGYIKQENSNTAFELATFTHKMIDGGLNLGYIVNLDGAIKPYGSIGFGISRIETEVNFVNPGAGGANQFITNSGNTIKETKPYFNYRLGLQFITQAAVIEAGYDYKAFKDLDSHLDGASLNLVDQDGAAITADDFKMSPLKNHIHSVSIGVKFPI